MSNVLSLSTVRDELGNLLTVYHGTAKQFDEFRLGKFRLNMQLGFGIHFAQQPSFARRYSGERNGRVIAAHLDLRKYFPADKIHHVDGPHWDFIQAIHKGTRRKPYVSDGRTYVNLDFTSPQRASRILQEFGYDGVRYAAKYGSVTFNGYNNGIRVAAESTSWVVLDPTAVHQIPELSFKTSPNEPSEQGLRMV